MLYNSAQGPCSENWISVPDSTRHPLSIDVPYMKIRHFGVGYLTCQTALAAGRREGGSESDVKGRSGTRSVWSGGVPDTRGVGDATHLATIGSEGRLRACVCVREREREWDARHLLED